MTGLKALFSIAVAMLLLGCPSRVATREADAGTDGGAFDGSAFDGGAFDGGAFDGGASTGSKRDSISVDAGEPSLRPGWVDTPMGLRMRAAPREASAVLSMLKDATPLDVLEEGRERTLDGGVHENIGGSVARWLRVRTEGRVGWVAGEYVARAKPTVQVQGPLMLRSIYDNWTGDEVREDFAVYLWRNGEWKPYPEVTGQPTPALADFTAKTQLYDIDGDGDPDIIVEEGYCCSSEIMVVFSASDGTLSKGPKLEGCDTDNDGAEDNGCVGLPNLVSVGPCGTTVVTVGPKRYVFSCDELTFTEVPKESVELR